MAGVRDVCFHAQGIFGIQVDEQGNPKVDLLGVEFLARNITPDTWNDAYVLAKALECAEEFYRRTRIRPHVNLYVSTLGIIPYVYNGSFPVVFELVEQGLVVTDLFNMLAPLKELYSENIFFALDDFGSGSSNFHLLLSHSEVSRCVFEVVKIDAQFVFPEAFRQILERIKREWGFTVIVEKAFLGKFSGADGYQSLRLHIPEGWRRVAEEIETGVLVKRVTDKITGKIKRKQEESRR